MWCTFSVALVESDSQPMGVTLVNTLHTNKMSDCMDLVELAKQVQKVCMKYFDELTVFHFIECFVG